MPYLETLRRWREARDPSLVAPLLDEAKLAARAYPAPSPARMAPDAFHALWLRVAESGGEDATPWLALTLTTKLESALLRAPPDRSRIPTERWRQRVESLLARAPDPVVTAAGLRVLREAEFGVITRRHEVGSLYELAFALVRGGGHTAIHAEIEALLEQHRIDQHDLAVADLVAPLEALLAELPTRAAIAPGATAPGASAAGANDEADLRAAVAAAIDDDAPRLVYADWLAERGDPLGELIVLQCQEAEELDPKRREKLRAAASSLFTKHKALWLGELAKVLTHVVMRRGFLASFALGPNHLAHEKEWERLAQDPLLRTVEEIAPGRSNKRNYALFVGSPAAVNLRVVHHVGSAETRALAKGPPRAIRTLVVPKVPAPRLVAELFAAEGFANLRRLELAPAVTRALGVGALSPLRAHLAARPIAKLTSFGVTGRLQASELLSVTEDLLAMPLDAFDVTSAGFHLAVRGRGEGRALALTLDDQPHPNAVPTLEHLAKESLASVRIHAEAGRLAPALDAALRAAFPAAERR